MDYIVSFRLQIRILKVKNHHQAYIACPDHDSLSFGAYLKVYRVFEVMSKYRRDVEFLMPDSESGKMKEWNKLFKL